MILDSSSIYFSVPSDVSLDGQSCVINYDANYELTTSSLTV